MSFSHSGTCLANAICSLRSSVFLLLWRFYIDELLWKRKEGHPKGFLVLLPVACAGSMSITVIKWSPFSKQHVYLIPGLQAATRGHSDGSVSRDSCVAIGQGACPKSRVGKTACTKICSNVFFFISIKSLSHYGRFGMGETKHERKVFLYPGPGVVGGAGIQPVQPMSCVPN